ncbi:hypothetical protein EX30DRAFT_347709 [Ascodesmis nigricans]|uniref:OTU domain-containing protein n=1 Tax=Ascodesmis nigricans TaxID=341454 RepID=A0A4S2N095_9PEZI|nr:hypothetical protein EX30DRAFT_347709 [Ascodesmis nigricans]
MATYPDSEPSTLTKVASPPRMVGHAGNMASITEYDDEFPQLETEGLYAAKTSGAGDCLFNSLSDQEPSVLLTTVCQHQLYGHENAHFEIRSRVVNHLRENPENFMSFIEVRPPRPRRGAKALSEAERARHTTGEIEKAYNERLARMAKSGTYGDNLEIQAFVNEYNTCVRVFQRDFSYFIRPTGNRTQGEFDPEDRPVIYIAHHTWEHYSSVRNRNGPHSGPPNVSPRPATPRTVEAAEERLATSTPFQPWMENAVSTALPYSESSDVIKATLRHFNYDVNETTVHLIEKWEHENGVDSDPQESDSSPQKEERVEKTPEVTDPQNEERVEKTPEVTAPLDVAEILVTKSPSPAPTPAPPIATAASLPTPSSIRIELQTIKLGVELIDEPRAKRRKSPDGIPIPVAHTSDNDTSASKSTRESRARRTTRKTTRPKTAPASSSPPTRRSARIKAKFDSQGPFTTSIYAETSSSDEESDHESSGSSSEDTSFVIEPPRSRKQRRQDAKAAASNKRKSMTAQPASSDGHSSNNGGRGMHTVTSGIRELYV